ncbi:hypothetical protein BKI52_29065 [marine bacterium AO1-C]|nr:hypothetical protein BKI52_29065 [marine bacterium AO1-C]
MTDEQKIEKIFGLLKSPVTANQLLAQQLWKSQNLAQSGLEMFQHEGPLLHRHKLSYLRLLEDNYPITKWGKSQFWRLYAICNECLDIATTEQWQGVQATLLLHQKDIQAQAVFYFSGVDIDFRLIESHIEYLNPLDKDGVSTALRNIFYRGGRYGRDVTSITRLITIRRKSGFPFSCWLEPHNEHQQKIHILVFYEATL